MEPWRDPKHDLTGGGDHLGMLVGRGTPAPRIFVSSTWVDLRAERHAVEQALQRMNTTRFVGMEYFSARDETTRDVSLAEVDRSDIYVGVIGHRYGSGITEAEYNRAVARGLPCLIYLKRGDEPAPSPGSDFDAVRLHALRATLRSRHMVIEFERAEELATAVAVGLHNLLFDRLVVDGLQALRSDYDARIQRFFGEYLGSVGAPIAFGGREEELHCLDAWFDAAAAEPCALLAGPAGRGKSALLVHWSRRLARRADIDVVFVPVSVRFRTNTATVVFGALAARLAALHGEVIPGALETPAEAWRALATALLRRPPPSGRRIVVVLDGADEAADWKAEGDLLPPRLPPGLRVVVSARLLGGDVDGQGWIERLEWAGRARIINLATLTPLGMTDVLRRMSVPLDQLSGRAGIVAELYRLTYGDPLLVNLYVSDLWTRGEGVARLRVEDLASIEPGLGGYFKRWWSDQRTLWGAHSPVREADVAAVLDTLACALGPLKTRELAELGGTAGAPLSVWSLDEAIRVLERFVIGDGETQGYAFTHPRLADHFRDRLAKAGQALEREMRFVAWGLRCLEAAGWPPATEAGAAAGRSQGSEAGAKAQGDVPDYVLQYLRAHMRRCGRPDEDFVALVGARWIAAWERLDRGTYGGFAADLDHVCAVAARRARDAARFGQTSPFAAVQWRGALIAGSIVGLNGEMPLAVVGALLERGVWSPTQAVAYATRLGDEAQRLRALLAYTGWFEPAYQALAISAAATSLTALGPRSTEAVREALRELAIGAVTSGATAAVVARMVAGAELVTRQVPGDQGRRMQAELVALLEWNGDDGPCLGTEQRIDAAIELLPLLPDYSDRLHTLVRVWRKQLADVPIDEGGVRGTSDRDPGPVWVHDRFRQLCDAVNSESTDAPPDMAYGALRAAFGVLLLRSAAVPAERAEVNALAGRVLSALPEGDVVDGLGQLLALPGSLPIQALTEHAAALPTLITRARALALLQRAAALPLSTELSRSLLDGAGALPVDKAVHIFGAIVDVLDVADQAQWLSLLAEGLERSKWLALIDNAGTRLEEGTPLCEPDPCLRLYAQQTLSIVASLVSDETATSLGALARNRIAAYLSVLCDRMEVPGFGDALEPWRVGARRAHADDVSHLERILDRAQLADEALRPIALRLAAAVADQFPQVLQGPAFVPLTGHYAADADAIAFHARYQVWIASRGAYPRDEHDRHPLHACLIEQVGNASADELLRRLAACGALLTANELGAAVASVLGELSIWQLHAPDDLLAVLAILKKPPLMPPVPALQRALGQLGAELALCGWTVAEPYVRQVASAPMPDAIRIPLIDALLEHAIGRECNEVVRSAVEALARESVNAPSVSHTDDREAADKLRQALARASTRRQPRPIVDHAVAEDAAGTVERPTDDAARLRLLLSEARWGRPTRAVMIEALALATRLGEYDDAVTLAHLVLLRGDEHPQLLAAVVDAALALCDDRRAALFAEVAPRLSGDALASAVQRLRRLDDSLQAVRAMLALLADIGDGDRRASALSTISAAIERMSDRAQRAAAGVLLAPEVALPLQLVLLSRAASEDADRCLLIDDHDLYPRWAQALAGAPVKILDATLNALRRNPGRAQRAGFGLRLLPLVPEWMRPRVLDLVADDAEAIATAAPWLDAGTLDRIASRRPLWRGLPPGWADRLQRDVSKRLAGSAIDANSLAHIAAHGLCSLSTPRTDRERHAVACSLALAAEHLNEARRAEVAALASSIGNDELRAEAGGYCATLAPPEMHAQAIQAVQAIRSDADRAVALALIAQTSATAQQQHLITRAFQAAAREADTDLAVQAAAECLRLLADNAWDVAIDAALPLLRGRDSRNAVGKLLVCLTDAQAGWLLAAVLGEALEVGSKPHLAHDATLWLQHVAPDIGPESARAALAVLQKASEGLPAAAHGRALAAIAPRLPDDACAAVGSSRVDLQACKLEYSIVSPK